MQKTTTTILYQAYGQKPIYQQVLFSLLTLYYHLNGNFEGITIVIYTDQPSVFTKYITTMPVKLELLTPEMIQAFKGSNHFIHRVKICIIKDCFTKYNNNIFYLDSDTYFTNAPIPLLRKINGTTSIMNADDYDLINAHELFENMDWLLIRRAIRDYHYVIGNQTIKIPLTTRMWNAGVIGLSVQNAPVLDEVLDLTDQIHANKKVFTAEQFAFSYFLQHKTDLISSGDVIFHYWPNFIGKYWKNLYNQHFAIFFKKHQHLPVPEQAQLAFQLTQQHEQIIKPPKRTLLDKILYRLKLIATVAITGKTTA